MLAVKLSLAHALKAAQRVQVRKNRHIEIIPLSTGCLGACTYCKTKHARGVLGSYTMDAIVARARQAVADPEVGPEWLQALQYQEKQRWHAV